MTAETPRSGNPIIRLVRQTASFFILFASVLLAGILAVQTSEMQRSPVQEYHALLAEWYLRAEDWRIIHAIERQIDVGVLDGALREVVLAQVWDNYVRAPEEYRYLDYIDVVHWALSDRGGEYYTILRNRSDYLQDDTVSPMHPVLLQAERNRLSDLVYLVRITAGAASATIDQEDRRREELRERYAEEGRAREALEWLLSFEELQSVQRTLAACNSFVYRYGPLYSLVSARYRLVVYDSLQRVNTDSLVDLAEGILLDPAEDPYLRLVAAEYLNRHGDRVLLAQQIYGLLGDAVESDSIVQGPLSETAQETMFVQELLGILGDVVGDLAWQQTLEQWR